MMRYIGDVATFAANQHDRLQPVRVGPLNRFDNIGRVAADGQGENQIPLLAVILQLPHENVFVRVIVSDGAYPTDIVIKRKAAKAPSEFVRRTFPKVGDEMGGIGRAAAVAEDKYVAILVKRG